VTDFETVVATGFSYLVISL